MANKGGGKGGGGNAHDRAVAKTASSNAAELPKPASGSPPTTPPSHSHLAEEKKERFLWKFFRDTIIAILGGVVLEPTFQRIHVDVNPYLREIWLGILGFLTIDALWRTKKVSDWSRSTYASLTGRSRAVSYLIVGAVGALCFCAYWFGVTAVLGGPEKAALSFDAEATNIQYPGETIAGIPWKTEYARTMITVKSIYNLPMDLSFTVTIMDQGAYFVVMDKVSSTSDFQVHSPPPPEIPEIQILGKDGSRANVKPVFEEMMAKNLKLGAWYRITCPRFEPEDTLMIDAITNTENKPGIAPSRLRIAGSYETSPSEGSKRISFDRVVTVRQ